jgi:malonyl-CoA decarboxylase
MSTWFDRLLASITERGRAWIRIPSNLPPLDQLYELAANLVSETGEASGAALAGEVLTRYRGLDDPGRLAFLDYLATGFAPDADRLRAVAERYLAAPSPDLASDLWQAAEPPRQELLRRLNMGQNGTATLVAMREQVLGLLKAHPSLRPLDRDLRHLLGSWFNRGFLEMRRIDWHTPRRSWKRLSPTRRCMRSMAGTICAAGSRPTGAASPSSIPALPDEPLIFVEVAWSRGWPGRSSRC